MLPEGFLVAETVATQVDIKSKKRVLEYVAELFVGQNPQLEITAIFEKLIERERLGSTGLGKGIALPHARIENLEKPQAVFIGLESPIDFDSLDGQPVDLVVSLLVPAEANDTHLQILAGLAAFFNEDSNCASLRKATDSSQIIKLLVGSLENSLAVHS